MFQYYDLKNNHCRQKIVVFLVLMKKYKYLSNERATNFVYPCLLFLPGIVCHDW